MKRKTSSLPCYPMVLLRQRLARRKANLLDPNWLPQGTRDTKRFPIMYPGMTTAAYVALHQQYRPYLIPVDFTHRMGCAAPMLDPSQPEVIEEVLP